MLDKNKKIEELYKLKDQVQKDADQWCEQLTHYGLLCYYEKLGYLQCLNDLIKDLKYDFLEDEVNKDGK